ncbi:MAG: hypothetical protein JSV10_03820, partial [Candidatus Zixiibacteriota bacterium]
MNRHLSYLLSTCLILFLCLYASAEDGPALSGKVRLGYVFIDDDGRMSTSREVFDVYSGFTVQDLTLRGLFKKNSSFELNLSDINRDNRSLLFSLRKPGLLSLTSRFKQTRSVFDEEGGMEAKRNSSSVTARVQPTSFLKLRTEFFHYLREGDRQTYYEGLGIGGGEYDQFFWSAGFGGQLRYGKKHLDLEYRLRSLDDRKNDLLGRDGSRIRASLNTPLPDKAYLSLQYLRDENQLKESGRKLKSDLYKTSLIGHPTRQIDLSVKMLFQRTENQSTQITSGILKGTGEISYEFHPGYRFNFGFESERREDEIKGTEGELETTSRSYLVGAYAKFLPELSLKARYVFQDREDDDTVTLTGPYEDERILVQLKSRPFKQV